MRSTKKWVQSWLSVILMFGMLLSYVPPVMAIDEDDGAVIAQEELLKTEDSSALEEEGEDTEPSESTEERDQEAPAKEASAKETPAQEAPAQEASAEKTPAQEVPAKETLAQEVPAEETATEEAAAEEEGQMEEILYTLTYSGLSDSTELEVRKLDPEDPEDADEISKLQQRLEEQELYDAFEISMTNGEILDEEAGAHVTLHGYEVKDHEHTALYHFTDDGEIEELVYSAVDDEVSFVTKSFSPFVFAQAKEQEEQPDEAPTEEQPDEAPAEEQPDEAPAEEQPDEAPTEEQVQGRQTLDLKMKNLLSTGADNESDSDISIDTFRATLRSGATKNENGDYVWTATNNYADHAFIFRVTYSLSGTYEYQAGEIEIRIPKSILLNRNGKSSDYYELSIPSYDAEGLTDANVFVYKEDGDDIVIYNRIDETPAAQNGYFEVSYSTSERTYEYADYDPEGKGAENGNKNGKNGSNPFSAKITIKQNQVTKTADTAKIPVYIDTTAKIASTTKYTPTLYPTWVSAWGAKPTVETDGYNAADYYYLVWEVRSIISGTQPYNFSLVDTFDVPDGYVVGYKMQGETCYTSEEDGGGKVEGLKTDYRYGRYDYVLTRHSKETYNKLVETDERYTVTNTVTATVTPNDKVDDPTTANSSRSWTYEKPTFEHPTGYFYMYKWGLDHRDYHVYDSEDIRRFDLSDYFDKDTYTIPDLAYYTYVHGYPYPWTVQGDPNDYESYGKKRVTYELIDNELYLKEIGGDYNYNKPLTAADYQIDKITLDWYMQDAAYNGTTMRFEAIPVTYKNNDVITVYAQFNSWGDYWLKIGEYNLKEDKGTMVKSAKDYGVELSGKTFSFKNTKSICTGYKLVTSNAHYYTRLGAYPHVTLKSSNTVKGVVNSAIGSQKIALLNRDYGNVYQGENTSAKKIIGFVRNGTDYVIGVIRHGDIKKSEIGYRNDTVNRQYRITWSVEASESYPTGEGRAYVNQESGTFYDLLPLGGLYVPDSVIAYADSVRLSDGQYSVKTVENYKNSGRTMLIVQYNVPADKYYFTYSTSHAWDVILEYGENVRNTVAYETGNEDIGDGRPDKPNEDDKIEDKDLLTDLDPATDAEKFIYAQTGHTIKVLTAGSLGLYKQVRAAQDTGYSYSTKTYSDSDYSYRIRFATDEVTVAKDLILFDSLENYKVTAGANAGATSDWHGVLTGFDLSVPEKLGIAPVVYYSTEENLSIDGLTVDKNYNFAAHSEIWVSAQDYTGNLSDVKAFAIDLRHNKDGDSYILPNNTPVSVTVFMHAPKGIDSEATDPVAYNNIYLYNSVTDAEGYNANPEPSWSSQLNHQDYTQIRYRMVGDLKILKVDSTDGTTPVEGILFRLWGTSYYGTEVDEIATTNRYGRITFKNIERGNYFLQEVDGVADYQQDHIQMTVTVDENGDVHIGVPEKGQDGSITYDTDVYGNLILKYDKGTETYIIGNEPRIHGDLEFVKKATINGKDNLRTVPGVTFQISGTSDYGNDILMLLTSDGSGTVSIQNLELGSYEMTEVAVPDDIILSKTVYTVRCDSSGILSISYTDSEGKEVAISQDKTGDYVIVNEPTHSFTLWKMDPVNNESLSGATFTLTGTSDYETPVDMEGTSDENGMVTFDGLEPGSYVLKETVAPANHVLDDTPRVVTIESNGKVTIDGLTLDEEHHWFPVENERSSEGVITITKQWEGDDGEESDRPIPVIHLDTEAPTHSLPVATISKSLWIRYVNRDSSVISDSNRLRKAWLFTRNTTLTKEKVTASGSGWDRIDDQKTDYSIYFKYDTATKLASWWSDASIIYFPADSSYMFYGCSGLTSLDLSSFNTSKVTNMSYMFYGCSGLWRLDLSGFDTSKVTDMSYMFYRCTSLYYYSQESLDLSAFDTSKVTNMSYMFYYCFLPSLDLSGFDTSKVTNMSCMFRNCERLTSLNVSEWNTGNVTNMKFMFYDCINLTSLDASGWNISNVTDMSYMFDNCTALTSLDMSVIGTGNGANMSYMFDNCTALTSLDMSVIGTGNGTNMSYMFNNCAALKSLDLSKWNTSNVTNMSSMFNNCTALTSLDVSKWDTSKVTNMSAMFAGCEALTSLDVSNWDTSKVESMSWMFSKCTALTSLDLSKWNTSNVTNMRGMFYDCSKLESLDVSNWDTSNVTDMGYMFYYCSKLESLNVSNWKTSKVTNMSRMFWECTALTSLDVSKWDTSKVTNMSCMFYNCYKLTELNVSNWDTSKVTDMSYMFDICTALTSLDVSKWDTSSVTNMDSVFAGCEALTSLDVSNWDTSKVTNMRGMFSKCTALTSLNVSGFNTSEVTTMSYMFNGCTALTSLDLSSFDTGKVTNMSYMFNNCKALKTIYAGSGWNTASVSSSTNMFAGCTALKGGSGTAYDTNYEDKTYACIDNPPDDPGYLTYKEAPSATPSTPTPGSHTAPAFSTPTPAKTAGQNVAINQTSESKMYEGDDPANAYNQWVDNHDGTWTYRFNVYDEDATYYIWEGGVPGYTSDADAENAIEVKYEAGGKLTAAKNGDSRIVSEKDDDGVTHYSVKITNTKTDEKKSALTVKKTVTGGTAADKEKLFTFTVTLSYKSVTGYYGDMRFVGGVATVKLKNGQSATATGLPAGVTYTVVEAEANQDGFTTTSDGATGMLEAGKTAIAEFTNEKKIGGLKITKTVVPLGDEELTEAEEKKKFTFTITLGKDENGKEINGLYGDLIFKNGVATAYLAHGETVTVSGLPVGVTYEVTEETYTGYTTTYSGATGAIQQDETQAVTVTNTKTKTEVPTNGFTLKKLVYGTRSKEPFTFFIDFADLDPNSSYTYTVGPDDESVTFPSNNSGAARVSVKLKDTETAVFDGLPVGSTYTVTESASGYVASYTVTNDSESGSIASASGANRSSGLALQTGRETVDEDEQITVTFVNTSTVYDVSFIKHDSDGMFLDGALLQVLDGEDDTVVYAEWRSTGDIDTVQLPEGEYVLHEAEAPEGYTLAADIEFTVGEYGVVTINNGETTAEVAMTDEETKVIVSKVDSNGNSVAGAKLQILDERGNVIYGWISGSEAREISGELTVLTPYTLHEVSAPNGYALAQDIHFILDGDGTVYIDGKLETDVDTGIVSIQGGEKAENLTIQMIDRELHKLYKLPSSGSSGTYLFTISGVAILATALLLVMDDKRKEGRARKAK